MFKRVFLVGPETTPQVAPGISEHDMHDQCHLLLPTHWLPEYTKCVFYFFQDARVARAMGYLDVAVVSIHGLVRCALPCVPCAAHVANIE